MSQTNIWKTFIIFCSACCFLFHISLVIYFRFITVHYNNWMLKFDNYHILSNMSCSTTHHPIIPHMGMFVLGNYLVLKASFYHKYTYRYYGLACLDRPPQNFKQWWFKIKPYPLLPHTPPPILNISLFYNKKCLLTTYNGNYL